MAKQSKKFSEVATRIARAGMLAAAGALISGGSALAQFGPPAASGGGSQAAQLPLSGRTGQSGGATATQTTVPGATTSVDTLNPVIQVQGAYAGSAKSTSSASSLARMASTSAMCALRCATRSLPKERAARRASRRWELRQRDRSGRCHDGNGC